VALAREVDARIVLVQRDRDVWIRLVVAQPDVEARLVALDEVLLGEQRLGLGGGDQELDVVGRRDHLGRPWLGRGLGEVRVHAFADRLGLADVEHAPLGVSEQVDAWLVGELATLLRELGILGDGHAFEDTRRPAAVG